MKATMIELAIFAGCVCFVSDGYTQNYPIVPVTPPPPMVQQNVSGTPFTNLVPPNNEAWNSGWRETTTIQHEFRPYQRGEVGQYYQPQQYYVPQTQYYSQPQYYPQQVQQTYCVPQQQYYCVPQYQRWCWPFGW